MVARMSVWVSLATGAVGLLTLSALVGVVLAAILGSVGRDVSELLELEPWASTPLTHRVLPAEQVAGRSARV